MSHRDQPIANKLCTAAWRQRDHAQHKARLQNESPAVDAEPPRSYYINISRAKKDQNSDETSQKIERENKLLLNKMDAITHGSTTNRLDRIHPTYSHSLNEGARRRELRKIMSENTSILHRITARKPRYSREEWDEHKTRHDGYLQNIREKPISSTNPIPLLKFMRGDGENGGISGGSGGNSLGGTLSARPSHAYIGGNYSLKSFDGSQSTRSLHSSPATAVASSSSNTPSPSHTLYNPHRSGSGGKSSARVYTLSPLKSNSTSPPPPAPSKSIVNASSSSPSASPSSTTASPPLASTTTTTTTTITPEGFIQICQGGKNLGDSYVILAIQEIPGTKEKEKEKGEEKLESTIATPSSSSTTYLSSLTSSTINPSIHSFLFRTYDPLESEENVLIVPFTVLKTLPELQSIQGVFDDNDRTKRTILAETVSERLTLLKGELRLDVSQEWKPIVMKQPEPVATGGTETSEAVPAAAVEEATTVAPTSTSVETTPAVSYTDTNGVSYYYDSEKAAYLPFPVDQPTADPSAAATIPTITDASASQTAPTVDAPTTAAEPSPETTVQA